jgi:hypothetical protein
VSYPLHFIHAKGRPKKKEENKKDERRGRKCHAKTIMSTGKGIEAQRWTHIMCHLGRAWREKYRGRGEKGEGIERGLNLD